MNHSTGTTLTFDAAAWIARNTPGGTDLSAEAQQAVANFTTMWNFFESTLCDNSAKVEAFARVVEACNLARLPDTAAKTLSSCLAFWRMRYRTLDGFVVEFESLHFRNDDRRHHVEAVLSGKATSPKDELLALMIIIYRLRNNLFHGLKTLEMLNDQVQNLTNASRCLAAILEVIPSRFVAVQPPSAMKQ